MFRSLRVPYEPAIRWAQDIALAHDDEISKTARVQELIHAYRVRGHLMADIDPWSTSSVHPDLDISRHGLTLWDLDREYATGGFGGQPFMKLRTILGILRDSYCRTIGVGTCTSGPGATRMDPEQVERPYTSPTSEQQMQILRRLNAAEAFETFLQTKYVGQKRFSLGGRRITVAVLDEILEAAAQETLEEVAIGMPHRGRLNVLANIAGKRYAQIFREFEGHRRLRHGIRRRQVPPRQYRGVRGGKRRSDHGLAGRQPESSRAVNPVLEGIVRAKQDSLDRGESSRYCRS